MTEEKLKVIESDTVNSSALLRASFYHFIKVFHYYDKRQDFTFKPFHLQIINKLQDIADNNNARQYTIINIPVRMGKLLADDTPVLTRDGWKNHGDLEVGDYVLNSKGEFVRVLATSPKAEANCKITFSDGDVIYCHDRHEWFIKSRIHRKIIIKETNFLLNRKLDTGINQKGKHRYFYHLPKIEEIKGERKSLIVDPYALGAWLGDGTNTKPCITMDKKDYKVIEKIKEQGYNNHKTFLNKKTGVYSYYFEKLNYDLRKLGVCFYYKTTTKYIPQEYITASIPQRLELLAGLLDTDGHLAREEKRYHFSTSEPKLKDGIIQLISSFGWRVNITEQEPRLSSSGIQGKKKIYTISFTPDRYIPCQLERKQLFEYGKCKSIAFTKIEKGNYGKIGKCIQVAGGEYLAGYRLKPTHNSAIAKYFIAWTYARNINCNNIYTSYSDELVRKFSGEIKDIISSPLYNKLFGITIKEDTNNKGLWQIEGGGAMRACSMGGSLTGFGSGQTGSKDYGGCIMIDDPLKADESRSDVAKAHCIDYVVDTLLTRRNTDKTPVIIIMQRLAVDDLVGYIQEKGLDYEKIEIKALDENGQSVWPERFSTEALRQLERDNPYMFNAQYMQNPMIAGGNVIKVDKIRRYTKLPDNIIYTKIFCDFAMTAKTSSDYSVFALCGFTNDRKMYVIDVWRNRWEVPQLTKFAFTLWESFRSASQANKLDYPMPRCMCIEDKASGTGILQEFRQNRIYVEPLFPKARRPDGTEFVADKFQRVCDILGEIEAGNVYIPSEQLNKVWVKDFVKELSEFSADGTHAHDDQVDAGLIYPVKELQKPKVHAKF